MRVFIAIELPQRLKKKIYNYFQKFFENKNIKLVEEENLHLTMVFLGRVDEGQKDKIKKELGELKRQGRIRLSLRRAEVFPDKRRPHGVWINVDGEREKLFALYKKIVDRLLKAGVGLEERKLRFSPHITIGRFRKGVWNLRDVGEIGGEFIVKKVSFFESRLSPKGPKYTKIGEFEVE